MPSDQAAQATFWHVHPHLWMTGGGRQRCMLSVVFEDTREVRATMEKTIYDVYMAFYQHLGHQPQRREAYMQIPENAIRR